MSGDIFGQAMNYKLFPPFCRLSFEVANAGFCHVEFCLCETLSLRVFTNSARLHNTETELLF